MGKKLKGFIFIGLVLIIGSFTGQFSHVKCQENAKREFVNLLSDSPLQISELKVNSDKIGLYEKFEITFDLNGEWDNPFDPDQIKVDAHFVSPDGKQIIVPGFFYQEYRQNINNRLDKVGAPVWKVRFTPTMTGEYKYQVIAINKGKEIASSEKVFTSISYNANHGFLRISKTNPLYFEFIDGTPFFGVAMDKSEGDNSGSNKRFALSGGNFNRLFLTNGKFNIEETNTPRSGPDRGLGKMNLETSWNLDQELELNEKLGIYQMLTLTNQWTFNQRWREHAYNKANGGMLDSKNEYFTNEDAMKYFERRLRYHVARWGYSTSVFSWDLWNEYSAMGADFKDAFIWHQRMAHYLTAIDPFSHVIHTNDGAFNGRDEMNALPEMAIISTNTYAIKDISYLAEVWTKKMIEKYKKPYVLTEYGMGHNPGPGGYGGMDPERRMAHNGLWSPLMSGSAATGMAWEWNWLDHKLFYTYINAVSKIVDAVPFSKRVWKPVDVSSFEFYKSRPPYYSDVIFEGWPGNFARPTGVNPDFFQINKNGRVEQQESLNAVLTGSMGQQRSNNASKVTFKAEFPVNGEFVVYVTELRNTDPTPQLTVTLDDKEVLKKDLLPAKTENYNPVMYNQYYTIYVPKGLHQIRIENKGGGSFVTAFELKNYLFKNGPDLEIRGLQTEDYILLWLKNPKFTVLHELTNIETIPQPEGILELRNVQDGTWMAEWINTIDATYIKTELVKSSKQKIVLETPGIDQSVAVRLHKIPESK